MAVHSPAPRQSCRTLPVGSLRTMPSGPTWSEEAAHANDDRAPATFRLDLLPPASPAVGPERGKQKAAPKDRSRQLICLKKIGAGEGIRTLDTNLGNAQVVRGH